MQVRRPDGGIVPSTASRRFTSDAQVSSSKPLAHPGSLDGVAVLFPRSVVQGCQASSRLLMCVDRLGIRIGHSGHCRSKKAYCPDCAQRAYYRRRHQSTLWDSYSPTLTCRSSSPILSSASRPNQRGRAARAEARRMSASLGSRERFGMF